MLWFIVSAILLIMGISKGLQQKKKKVTAREVPGREERMHRKDRERLGHRVRNVLDASENDLQCVALLLSAGLVDADPSMSSLTLQIFKKYRDARTDTH